MRTFPSVMCTVICILTASVLLCLSTPALTDTGDRVHVVVKGDTLWDISTQYLYDPFLWPQVWNVNRGIENPHLIYPGQEILIPSMAMIPPPKIVEAKPVLPPPPPPVVETKMPVEPPPAPEPEAKPVPIPEVITHRLIQALSTYGFIIDEKEFGIGTISSMEENRMLISTGQKVYVTTPEEAPLEVDRTYSIVRIYDEVRHPRTGKKVGYLARILGDLSVVAANKELSTAMIGDVYQEIRLGDKVMEHVQYVTWHRKEKDEIEPGLEGYVLAHSEGRELMGKGDVLFLDMGTNHGLGTGDVLSVIADKSPETTGVPDEVIGQVEIVVPREKSSVAKVTESYREIALGAKVVSTVR